MSKICAFSSNFREWCERLPTNELLGKFSSWTESRRLCEACLRSNEEEEASNFCLACSEALCNDCTKYHRKNRASQDHKICPLDEIKCKNALEMSKMSTDIMCSKHEDRPIELYCNDHEEACCAMCCSTDHRKCKSVETIEQKANGVRSSESVDHLIRDLKNFEEKLSEAKRKQEKNITEIEDNVDKMTKEVQSLKERIFQHIEKLECEYLDEMSRLTKQCKHQLTRNVQAVRDRIHLMKHCITDLESAKGLQGSSFLAEFLKAKETLDFVKNRNLKISGFTIQSDLESDFKVITNLLKIGKTSVVETEENVERTFDFKSFKLELCQDIELLSRGARSVSLSTNGMFIPNLRNMSIMKYCRENTTWNLQQEIKIGKKTFDIKQEDNLLFVSCPENSEIKVLNSDDFKEIRTLDVGCKCLGLSIRNNFLYVACEDSIIKMETEGNLLKTYSTDKGVIFVVVSKEGLIVYSNYLRAQVTAITDGGSSAWIYSHPSLDHSCGLHIDSDDDIIYVAGTESNNIHVLSIQGSLLKIVGNILQPVYFTFNEERNLCCVITKVNSGWQTQIKIYSVK